MKMIGFHFYEPIWKCDESKCRFALLWQELFCMIKYITSIVIYHRLFFYSLDLYDQKHISVYIVHKLRVDHIFSQNWYIFGTYFQWMQLWCYSIHKQRAIEIIMIPGKNRIREYGRRKKMNDRLQIAILNCTIWYEKNLNQHQPFHIT